MGVQTCASFEEGVLHAWIGGWVVHPVGLGAYLRITPAEARCGRCQEKFRQVLAGDEKQPRRATTRLLFYCCVQTHQTPHQGPHIHQENLPAGVSRCQEDFRRVCGIGLHVRWSRAVLCGSVPSRLGLWQVAVAAAMAVGFRTAVGAPPTPVLLLPTGCVLPHGVGRCLKTFRHVLLASMAGG